LYLNLPLWFCGFGVIEFYCITDEVNGIDAYVPKI